MGTLRSSGDSKAAPITDGHLRTLAMLGNTDDIKRTLALYRAALDGEVYLRLTADGLTAMSLDAERCRSMISVGSRGMNDDVLKACPPTLDAVRAAVKGYTLKRDSLGRGSVEEQFSVARIAGALSNHLVLPNTDWLFLHQEWRLLLPEGPGKIDLLAVDQRERRLVVIECKASTIEVDVQDRHGWVAAQQADAYGDAVWAARDDLYPFFSELLHAMAAIYAPDALLESFALDPAQRPTTAVWWPGHTPNWPAWNSAELQVKGDSSRVARYRRHQSRFREQELHVGPGPRPRSPKLRVGNTLDTAAVAANPRLNFIDDDAYRHAIRRSAEVKAEGGTLEPDRLFQNLMSSMPMCFNLFGSIGTAPAFLDLVRELFDPEAVEIDEVKCEVKPTDALGDRTAFDAIVWYRTARGEPRFLGIETKYTEPFSQRVYDNTTYREVTDASSWFTTDAAEELHGSATNQLWRGLMLASLTEGATASEGRYVVVTPADDDTAREVVELAARHLTDPSRLSWVTLEQIVACARRLGDHRLSAWAEAFASRYLP